MCLAGLCESLGLIGLSRWSYEVQMDERYGTTATNIEWIREYTNEEKRGVMLLQRERRLKEEANQEAALGGPPKYQSTSNSENQIKECRQQYWLHLQELLELQNKIPRGPAIEHWEMLRRLKNRQGRSIAWEEASRTCAALGGCCARDCGCCSEPQNWYSKAAGSGHQNEAAIYGHCTVECSCCIRFRGFYKPDSSVRLPELA
ncbi:hypothetical protein FQN54_004744 [Arachnomyces sp. PD_36]|nr:hypothetical protein FQN54_004744 [Arachnomyces sp. PD_36]